MIVLIAPRLEAGGAKMLRGLRTTIALRGQFLIRYFFVEARIEFLIRTTGKGDPRHHVNK